MVAIPRPLFDRFTQAPCYCLLITLLPSLACAEQRIALLIGNQAYNPKVGPLKNPHADIELVGASLKLLSSLDAVVFIRLQTQ
jgi:hypothetical protein